MNSSRPGANATPTAPGGAVRPGERVGSAVSSATPGRYSIVRSDRRPGSDRPPALDRAPGSDRRPSGGHRTVVARERASDYATTEPPDASTPEAHDELAASEAGRMLEEALTALRAVPVDELSESALAAEVAVLERACRQLSARQSRAMAALARRRSRRAKDAARAAGRGEHVAGERATRELRRELADKLGWSPAEAKRSLELGRQLEGGDPAGRAFDAGELPARHAAVLADTLKHLVGDARRDAETELVALATRQDPVEFGRSCRRLLARLDAAAAERADQRRQARRSARVWHSEDGMTGCSAALAGLDAETFTTAWHAFRRPDAPDEHRTPEQAGADALVAMARAALDAGLAPHDRRTPPHVQVTIDWQHVLTGAGLPEGRFTGPLPTAQIRRLLADCGVSRLLVDSQGVPMEAGARSRTVPVGVHRSIETRDRTCIEQHCDVPAAWCQVMHLGTPFRLDGRLTVDSAAMGCSYHHYAYDHLGWQITWHGRRPILHHPDRPPPPPDPADRSAATSSPTAPADRSAAASPPTAPADRSAVASPPTAPAAQTTPVTAGDADRAAEVSPADTHPPPDDTATEADVSPPHGSSGRQPTGPDQLPLLEPP